MRSTLPYVGGAGSEQPASISPPVEASPARNVRRGRMKGEVFMSTPEGHGADLTLESGNDDHQHVSDQKQDQRDEDEEMNRARGLGSAEHIRKECIPCGD